MSIWTKVDMANVWNCAVYGHKWSNTRDKWCLMCEIDYAEYVKGLKG